MRFIINFLTALCLSQALRLVSSQMIMSMQYVIIELRKQSKSYRAEKRGVLFP